MQMEEDDQVGFSITKVDYTPPRPVIHMVTSNNILVMALDNGKLIRLDLRDTSDLRDIDVGPNVRKMFIDPTGNHLIISTAEDTQYLNRTWVAPKPLKSLKNLVVTSVGWDITNSDANNTGTILLGSASGQIYEVSIEAGSASTMLRSLERGLKLLYTFPDAETLKTAVPAGGGPVPAGPAVLDGLGWFRVPGTRAVTHCVFVSSAARIWQFVGGASLEGLFAAYQNVPPYGVYHTLPNEGSGTKSVELHFYHKYGEQATIWPKSLAWFLAPSASAASSASQATASPYSGFHEGAWMANFSFTDVASGKMDTFGTGGSIGSGLASGLSSGATSPSNIQDVHQFNVIDSFKHVPFGDKPADAYSTSMVLTEFHYIILYHNGLIQFISRLTNELVFECKCNVGRSMMRGLAHDPRTNITFAYTENQLFEVHIDQEDKNVWRMYLRNGQYDLAEQYAREEWQKDTIWTAAANHYFSTKLYKIAAELFAKTSRSFEEVTLKFLNENATPALMVYLKEKLKTPFQSEMQPTVLCTWLTELYLAKLNDIEAQQTLLAGTTFGTGVSSGASTAQKSGGPSLQALKESFSAVQDEFHSFLHQYETRLNRATTMNLITSYGRINDMLEYARVVKAYDLVVAFHVQHHSFDHALLEIRDRYLPALLTKHGPIFLQYVPAKTVDTLIAMHNDNIPREILPAFMRYQSNRKLALRLLQQRQSIPQQKATTIQANQLPLTGPTGEILDAVADGPNQAVRYAEYLIFQLANKDTAVHNFLISLYAEDDVESGDEKFLRFVENPIACIDLEYALGLCEQYGKLRAQVAIYSKMGLYEEAVALALKGNFVDLAKTTADAVEEDERRKKLWLELAGYMIQKDASHDVGKVMKFIQQSGILKIEDVLPIFPAFVVINDFKEEICRSLTDYKTHIDELVGMIEDSTTSAQKIRADIDKLPNKFGAVSSNQTCELCRTPILSKSFYLFPCSHVYHQNCLIDYLKPLLTDEASKMAMIALAEILMQRRLVLAQKAAMERDRDSAFANAQPHGSSSILPSFLDGKINPDGTLSRLLADSPLSGLNLPFGSQPGPLGPAPSAPSSNAHLSLSNLNAHNTMHTPTPTVELLSPLAPLRPGQLPPTSVLATWTEKQLQDELDNYIACECPLCGDLMIESVPRPLMDAKSAASWAL